MIVGPAALACGAETAPGTMKAPAASKKIKGEQVFVMVQSIQASEGIAKLPRGTILDSGEGKNDEQ